MTDIFETQPAAEDVALETLIKRWAKTQAKADEMKAEILKRTIVPIDIPGFASVKASISRGSYDYEGIARTIKIPAEVQKRYETVVIDWKKACEEVGIPAAVKEQFYKGGVAKVGAARWDLKLEYVIAK